MMQKQKQLLVIGGGAAGFFGAIQAKSVNPDLAVTILESAPKPLGKVKISGGGRCNVTHACFDVDQLVQHYPRGAKALKSVFTRFGPKETIAWFESQGVRLKTEADGRIFPITDDSQTIIDCLWQTASSLGVSLQCQNPVEKLAKTGSGYQVVTKQGVFQADFVLLSSGSNPRAYQWAKDLGHTVVDPVPSLFTFQIHNPLLENLSGISFSHVKAKLDVPGEKPIVQEGPLLITHWGLSGPVVLRLSAWGARVLFKTHYQAKLYVDFVPKHSQEQVQQSLHQQKLESPQRHVGNENPFGLPKRFWEKLVQSVQLSPDQIWQSVSHKALNQLSERLKHCGFQIAGKGPFKEEFVTAGGILLNEIDFKTMESRCSKGLYLAGEVIDVDGLTGGFNFQNAWSTGWLAGNTLARQ